MILLAACGQGGSPVVANQAEDDFLAALVHRNVDEAWSHLDPETRQRVYGDDEALFAREVNEADWSRLSWEFGPVVNLDYAWEVHVVADRSAVPDFLFDHAIAVWTDPWFVMQVQTPLAQPYLIIAEQR